MIIKIFFYDDDTLDSDENTATSWSTENIENSTNDTQGGAGNPVITDFIPLLPISCDQ